MASSEEDWSPYGKKYTIKLAKGGSISVNRNQHPNNINEDAFHHLTGAFVVQAYGRDSGSYEYIVLSDEEMQELFRAYLRVRAEIEELMDGNTAT